MLGTCVVEPDVTCNSGNVFTARCWQQTTNSSMGHLDNSLARGEGARFRGGLGAGGAP